MLVLCRKQGESFKVGDNITITIVRADKEVRIGIDAPKELAVVRDDTKTRKQPG